MTDNMYCMFICVCLLFLQFIMSDKLRKLNDGITVDSLVYFAEQHACIEDTGASTAISLSGYIDTVSFQTL